MQVSPGIDIDAVGLQLDAHTVFDGLGLHIEAGRWHCILGRSGMGKTSLLRLLAGLEKPTGGTISADDGTALQGQVAYLSQDDGLLPWLSVVDNVQLGPRLRSSRNSQTHERAKRLLDQVGLAGWCDHLPGTLSGGMRQRTALARTLMEDRRIVLLDEPFSRLDAITRHELQTLAFELLAGCTVVLVTHDPYEALRLAHRVSVLQCGNPARLTGFDLPSPPPRETNDPNAASSLARCWAALQDS